MFGVNLFLITVPVSELYMLLFQNSLEYRIYYSFRQTDSIANILVKWLFFQVTQVNE